jgi:hypothetical protein
LREHDFAFFAGLLSGTIVSTVPPDVFHKLHKALFFGV